MGTDVINSWVMVGREPVSLTCPNCGNWITTRTEDETTLGAYIGAGWHLEFLLCIEVNNSN